VLINRTTGSASVVPELVNADVAEAIDWLCAAFGFAELLRVDGHRVRVGSPADYPRSSYPSWRRTR
jgi:hypothetical protein